jgi:hypothetical protein
MSRASRHPVAPLGCVLALAILGTHSAVAEAATPPLDAAAAQAEAAGFLRDLIRLDTSDPPGNESQVARYL